MSKSRGKITVVTEDAYKQNTVYRPWVDIIAGRSAAHATSRPAADDRNKSYFIRTASLAS